jgi:hypothetical protein
VAARPDPPQEGEKRCVTEGMIDELRIPADESLGSWCGLYFQE